MTRSPVPVADCKMWDNAGNYCRAVMYAYGANTFEVYYTDLQNDVPRRFIGTIGECNAHTDLWISHRKVQGFQEQLPSYNPEAWRA
jgi:hypothetical protein